MEIKVYLLLAAVLGINSLRYGTYLLEGPVSIYYGVMFALNLLALIVVSIQQLKTIAADPSEK